eukprot:TRINITY_DN66255_c0_g1_i1.p1 TRINITY_DN66255_c0_g1~~TRINITY_DN66255_c0_g1_i1.p1  ORF type:complete len:305 (+),score=78.67 TRINITY_DN66255_c0_g1_i1:70-984(+)
MPPGGGLLRRTRVLAFLPVQAWETAATNANQFAQAFRGSSVTASDVYGEWDPKEAAISTFKVHDMNATAPLVVKRELRPRLDLLRAMATCSIATGLTPLGYAGMISTPGMAELAGACAVALAAFKFALMMNRRVISTALRIRIVPSIGSSAVGAQVEVTVFKSCFATEPSLHTYPLHSLTQIAISQDGLWRCLVFTQHGKSDTVHLRLCPNAHHVIPFLISMKRHLEVIAVEEDLTPKEAASLAGTPLQVVGSVPETIDPARFMHRPDPTVKYADVTLTSPYPGEPLPAEDQDGPGESEGGANK